MKNIIFRMVAIAAIFAFSQPLFAIEFNPQSAVVRLWAQNYKVQLITGVDDNGQDVYFTPIRGSDGNVTEGFSGYTFYYESYNFIDAVNEFPYLQNNIMAKVQSLQDSTAYKAAFWADSYGQNNQVMSVAMATAYLVLANNPMTLQNTEEIIRIKTDIMGIQGAMEGMGKNDKLEELVKDLDKKLSEEINKANEKAKEATQAVNNLEDEVSTVRNNLNNAETNISSLQAKVNGRSNDRTVLEGRLDTVDASLLSLQETSSYLSEQVDLLTAQKNEYNANKTETENKISVNSTKIGELTTQIATLNQMKQGASEIEIEILEGLIELNTLDIQALQSENVSLNSKITGINASIAQVTASITATNAKIATIDAKITELENKQNELQGDISNIGQEIETYNERITELSDEVSELRDDMNEKIEQLKTEIQTLKGSLAKAAVTKVTQEIVNKTENIFPVTGVSIGDLCYTNAMLELSKYMGNSSPTNGGVAFDAPTRGEGGEKFTSIDEYLNWKGVTVAVTNQNSEYGMAFVLGSNRLDSVTAPFGAPENWVAEGGGIVVTNGQYRVMFGGAWSYADGGFMGCTVQMGSIGWHQSFMPYSAIGDVYAVITYSDVDNPSVTLSATPVNVRGETISIWVGTLVSDGNGGVRAISTRNSPITIIMYE